MRAGALALVLSGGWASSDTRVAEGQKIYAASCVQCHGQDGRGNPEWESLVRPIDLTDCGTTAEPAELWEAVVRRGGAAHGLSSVMPAFGEAYSADEIGAVVAYLRTFCETADRYPPGDLNFRRPLATGKAFPEAELVLRVSHRPDSEARETELEVIYENRLGSRFQYELELPLRLSSTDSAGEATGVGDLVVAGKQVIGFSLRRREILSAGLELTLPTGSESKQLSSGTFVATPYLAYGRGFGRTLVQARSGVSAAADTDAVPSSLRYAFAISQALGPARTSFTPAIEWTGELELESGRNRHALWLEVSKPLNRLGHVIAAAGVRVPIRPRAESLRLEAYLLWDFGDGPVWVGW
ncbi:MAG TPA: cytochrome c [Vicinamibacteria bacterium]|nr:cytochrome c [Vicinamibacteria bacterium]